MHERKIKKYKKNGKKEHFKQPYNERKLNQIKTRHQSLQVPSMSLQTP